MNPKRFRWDTKYLYWGVTAFVVIAACVVFYLVVSNLGWLRNALGRIMDILSPFIWGLVIAYLLFPLTRLYTRVFFEPLCQRIFQKSPKRDIRIPKVSRGLSIFLSVLTLLIVVVGLLWLVGPQLYSSLERIVINSSDYIARADAWLNRMLSAYPEIGQTITGAFGDLSNGIVTWASDNVLPEFRNLISNLTMNLISMVRSIYNAIIGIIVSVYVLYSRETFAAKGKKLLYALSSPERAGKILQFVEFTNQTFMGFLSGKVLDSLIMGLLCYICCLILRMPYALLVAFVVGLTNIIPFFGPIIGAIPATIIILTESPWKALGFLVLIIVLQQFDGNVLGPKILGSRVGINGFWVLFSIILGAGLFGFAGMLLGVPVFVIIYTLIRDLLNRKLTHDGMPTDTAAYMDGGALEVSSTNQSKSADGPESVNEETA